MSRTNCNQLRRLLDAHEIVLDEARTLAREAAERVMTGPMT
jgi:hypothetical protein